MNTPIHDRLWEEHNPPEQQPWSRFEKILGLLTVAAMVGMSALVLVQR